MTIRQMMEKLQTVAMAATSPHIATSALLYMGALQTVRMSEDDAVAAFLEARAAMMGEEARQGIVTPVRRLQ